MQLHAVVLAMFASIIAPFGGFFASGFKRGFKIKDFGDSIPGHGGMTDRMDCQVLTLPNPAGFQDLYFWRLYPGPRRHDQPHGLPGAYPPQPAGFQGLGFWRLHPGPRRHDRPHGLPGVYRPPSCRVAGGAQECLNFQHACSVASNARSVVFGALRSNLLCM